MRVTLNIPDDLAAQVRLRGLTPEGYVQSLVDDAARTTPTALPPAKPKMEMEAFLQAMAANSTNIPHLPDEAFTRESFYQDHD
jgi:hypothetical protein